MRLKFRWKPRTDESDELKIACDSLLKQPAAMSEVEKASLGNFLQDRIAEARRRDDVGTWHAHLAESLDYRTWFAFEIHRQTDDKWERLTKRTHGTGSGGERAVSLIMPMSELERAGTAVRRACGSTMRRMICHQLMPTQ